MDVGTGVGNTVGNLGTGVANTVGGVGTAAGTAINGVLAVPQKLWSNVFGSSLFTTNSLIISIGIVIGALILLGLLANSSPPNTLNQRKAAAPAKPAPKLEAKAAPAPALPAKAGPKIERVVETKKPVLQPKSVSAPAPVAPAVVQTKPATIETTFEAYRQAMLNNGPRQMDQEARAEMTQMKTTGVNAELWREQTASLREQLKNETLAEMLERTNVSINDRMVAMFDSVKA